MGAVDWGFSTGLGGHLRGAMSVPWVCTGLEQRSSEGCFGRGAVAHSVTRAGRVVIWGRHWWMMGCVVGDLGG